MCVCVVCACVCVCVRARMCTQYACIMGKSGDQTGCSWDQLDIGRTQESCNLGCQPPSCLTLSGICLTGMFSNWNVIPNGSHYSGILPVTFTPLDFVSVEWSFEGFGSTRNTENLSSTSHPDFYAITE